MTTHYITTPLTDNALRAMHIGDEVCLSGTIYTARDAAHKLLVASLKENGNFPIDLAGQTIYYTGPSPTKPNEVIGSAGPTTSYRMDAYPELITIGKLRGMIGKGQRSPAIKAAMQTCGCVYLVATGGAAVLISESIMENNIVLFEELGAEAMRKIEVQNLHLIVATDIYGHDLYEEGPARWQQSCHVTYDRNLAEFVLTPDKK